MTPLAIDLYCGLGGWTEGLLAEGYDVIGFDIERHIYGEHRYPAQLVLQDVLTLHGRQFKDAALIVASPPCQEYSYMAMPWSKAKAIEREYRSGVRDVKKLTALFDACFRIQREACEAAGRHIPMVVENVRGAQPWVGRSCWNFGSYYLWGDVPALMPMTKALKTIGHANMRDGHSHTRHLTNQVESDALKNPGFRFDGSGRSTQSESVDRHIKNNGGSWFNVAHNTTSGKGQNPDGRRINDQDIKDKDANGYERNHPDSFGWKAPRTTSKSSARKAASAQIAKIPLPLARYIARTYRDPSI